MLQDRPVVVVLRCRVRGSLGFLVKDAHAHLDDLLTKHFARSISDNTTFLKLFLLRRHVEESYYVYTRLKSAFLHLQRWRIWPLPSCKSRLRPCEDAFLARASEDSDVDPDQNVESFI